MDENDPVILMDLFSLWLGTALHTTRLNDPEITNFDNPVGIIQVDLNFTDKTKAFCKHESSIVNREEGYGFNECGLMLKVW
jgi:hypothetical protein